MDGKRFGLTPEKVFADPSLSYKAKVIYGVLSMFAHPQHTCFPKQTAIALAAGTHRRRVKEAIEELRQSGYVTTQRGRYGLEYTLHPDGQKSAHLNPDPDGTDSAHLNSDGTDPAHLTNPDVTESAHLRSDSSSPSDESRCAESAPEMCGIRTSDVRNPHLPSRVEQTIEQTIEQSTPPTPPGGSEKPDGTESAHLVDVTNPAHLDEEQLEIRFPRAPHPDVIARLTSAGFEFLGGSWWAPYSDERAALKTKLPGQITSRKPAPQRRLEPEPAPATMPMPETPEELQVLFTWMQDRISRDGYEYWIRPLAFTREGDHEICVWIPRDRDRQTFLEVYGTGFEQAARSLLGTDYQVRFRVQELAT